MTDTKEMIKVENKSWDEALENEAWVAPLVNISEKDEEFVISAFMPGVLRDNVKIKIEDGSLIIMGRIDYEDLVNQKYVLNEFAVGNYYRKFNLSDSIDDSKISAKFENSVLSVTLPKHERLKPRNIEIN